MDLNYLLFRQQVSLMRADRAASVEARYAHQGLARAYGNRIAQLSEAARLLVTPALAR